MEPAAEQDALGEAFDETSGSRALRISNAVGRIHKQMVGRGPTNVRTSVDDGEVVCLLEGGLTQAERTLLADSEHATVAKLRHRLQRAMRRSIIEAVEAIVGRRVRSFMSTNDPEHDLEAEILVLERREDMPQQD